MITLSNNSDSIIVVLHEIYGINQHIKQVCEYYNQAGFDIICPDLLNLSKSFDYHYEEDAYKYFMKNVGFSLASQQVKNLISQLNYKYKHIFILGYSIGATIAWLCSDMEIRCDGVIGYYGSRIRDYLYIIPKCKTLLIFAHKEESFRVNSLLCTLKKKANVNAYMLSGVHGFSDPFSPNYCDKSYREAEKLVNDFLKENNQY